MKGFKIVSTDAFVQNITGTAVFNPDILETIADLSNDEVFTPPQVAISMLKTLPNGWKDNIHTGNSEDYTPSIDVWRNPHLKWLDPAVKTGVFLREIAKNLMVGLSKPVTEDLVLKEKLETDEEFRRYWIYKNMLFGIGMTTLTSLMARRSLYYTKFASNPELSVYPMDTDNGNIIFPKLKHTFALNKDGKKVGSCTICSASQSWDREGSLESHAYPFLHASEQEIIGWFKEANADIREEENMHFDVIIGNPPYQLADDGHGASAVPLYHIFIEKSIAMEPRYVCMITPSRWFQGGKGLDSFRARMLKDKRISHIVDFPASSEVFPSVEIKGGVNYFLWDSSYSGKCKFTLSYKGSLKSSNRDLSQFEKFIRYDEGVELINKITGHQDFKPLSIRVSSRQPFGLPTNFKGFEPKPAAGKIKIYARGAIGYVEKAKVPRLHQSLDSYKVLLAIAGSDGTRPDSVTSNPLLVKPSEICTETYLVLNWFNTESEAKNMLSYAKTKFFRYMLSLLKNTQHITQDRFKYVPDLDMTEEWTDKKLYEYFGLTEDEIKHIEESIKEMS